jgi:hypothetical protein
MGNSLLIFTPFLFEIINSLLYDQIETTLNFSLKFLLFYCSSMTVPVPTQPNIEPGLSNQTHIALNLFDTILKTTATRVELERSWATIKQDITIQEQLEARQRQCQNIP